MLIIEKKIICNRCNELGDELFHRPAYIQRRELKKAGWKNISGKDYCPKCKPNQSIQPTATPEPDLNVIFQGASMKCKKSQSENLVVVTSGPHQKLVCGHCKLVFQKFLSKSEAKNFREIKDNQPREVLEDKLDNV